MNYAYVGGKCTGNFPLRWKNSVDEEPIFTVHNHGKVCTVCRKNFEVNTTDIEGATQIHVNLFRIFFIARSTDRHTGLVYKIFEPILAVESSDRVIRVDNLTRDLREVKWFIITKIEE